MEHISSLTFNLVDSFMHLAVVRGNTVFCKGKQIEINGRLKGQKEMLEKTEIKFCKYYIE